MNSYGNSLPNIESGVKFISLNLSNAASLPVVASSRDWSASSIITYLLA